MGNTSTAGMPGTSDPLAELAVGLAADHQEQKAKRGKAKPQEEPAAPDQEPAAAQPPEQDGNGEGVNTGAMEASADQAELIAGTLVGDMRDAMMEVFKHRPKPWSQMLAGEQRDVATAMEYAAKVVVKKAVLAIAAEGRPSIQAVFKGYADKGGELSGTVKFLDVQDEDVLALHRASGKTILLVVADAQGFSGQRRDPDVRDDQEELEFDAGTGDDTDLAEQE